MRLLNTLLRASGGGLPLPDSAAQAFAQFAGHVREDVLGQLNQRGYKCADSGHSLTDGHGSTTPYQPLRGSVQTCC